MKKIKVKTPAKINLTLEVLNKRKDGFHNIQSVMHTINLYDYLSFEICKSKYTEINLNGNSSLIPYDSSNLVYKAAVKFFESAKISDVKLDVYIEKNIPIAAGLAGGSTNAAGTFFALNKLFNNILSDEDVDSLCASLGSDLNFCLKGGCCLCTSRGEIIEKLPPHIMNVSLIKPKNLGISAKEAYMLFSQLQDKSNPDNTNKLKAMLLKGEFDESLLYNSLEYALFPKYEQLRFIKEQLQGSLMSGSGSTFFVLDEKIDANFDKTKYDIFENLMTIKTGVEEV